MVDDYSSSTSPQGVAIYRPKILGQSSIVRQEISRYGSSSIGLQVVANGTNVDVDSGSLHVVVYVRSIFTSDDTLGIANPIPDANITQADTGVYEFTLDGSFTGDLALLSIQWVYSVQGNAYTFWDYYQILDPMPVFDSLNDGERGVVRIVINMFADLYDSVEGGPHLKEEFQTHFGTETIARCLELACNRVNITSQPYTNYTVGLGQTNRFPPTNYSVLVFGTYLEVVRHLIRSYTEQPQMAGGPGIAILDRSSYIGRWRDILNDEKDDYARAVRSFKRGLLSLGSGSLLVAGGIFGQSGYWRSGSYAASQRAARFYPMSFVQVRPG